MMIAKYEGVCLECGMWFPPGTPITRHSQHGWKHEECPSFASITNVLVQYIAAHPEECKRMRALQYDPEQLPKWVELAVSKHFENIRLSEHERDDVRRLNVSARVQYRREARAKRREQKKALLKELSEIIRKICSAC